MLKAKTAPPDRNYITRLQNAIWRVNHCESKYIETVAVSDPVLNFQESAVGEGEVAVFELRGHPQTKRAYAWLYRVKHNTICVVVLEIPPITSAQTAFEAAIAAQIANGTFHRA